MSKPGELTWTCLHEIKALLIYKKTDGRVNTKIIESEINKDGLFTKDKIDSLKEKFGNIKYLETEGKEGRSNFSKLNKKVFEKYKNNTIEQLEQIIKDKQPCLDSLN